MGERGDDTAHLAFKRLLREAADGGQAKLDALVALMQRTVFVCTWTPDGDTFRTITNSNGQSALPIFSDPKEVQIGAQQLAWLGADGSVLQKEIGAREALRHAVANSLDFVVLDIGSDHTTDIDQDEMKPLLTQQARRDSSGPFAAVGRISSSMMGAVKPTPPPGSLRVPQAPRMPDLVVPEASPPPVSAPASSAAASAPPQPLNPPPPGVVAITSQDPTSVAQSGATFGSGSSVVIGALSSPPPEELIEALTAILRNYPEVEWACLAQVSRGPAAAVPTVGLRLDAGYRQRVNEIINAIRKTGDDSGATLDVLLLDDPQVMRTARSDALVFFPWRRK